MLVIFLIVSHAYDFVELTSLGQWWAGGEFHIHVDPETRKHFAKESLIVILNHRYEIDWMMACILAQRYGVVGVCKLQGLYMIDIY